MSPVRKDKIMKARNESKKSNFMTFLGPSSQYHLDFLVLNGSLSREVKGNGSEMSVS